MRKLAWVAFSFALGIFAAQYFLPVRVLPLAAGGVLGAGLVLYALIRSDKRRAAMLAAFGLAAGLLWDFGYDALIFSHARELDGATASVTATVADFPVETEYGAYVDVKVRAGGIVPLGGRVYVYDGSMDDLRPGDEVRFTAKISTADKIRDREITGYTSRGTFLFLRGVQELEVLASPGATLRNFHTYAARSIQEHIRKVFPLGADGFMLALLTGDRSVLNSDAAAVSDMERAGITHIVAVSGMHVAILAGFLMALLGRRRWTILVIAPVLLMFMAVSGGSPSVVRAVVMQLFVLTAPLVMRENDSLTSLSAALMLLLILNPYAVAGVGLQMSFAATLGIIVLSPRLQRRLEMHAPAKKGFKRNAYLTVARSVSTSLGALALTLPISAWTFESVSLVAPLSNLLILWAVSPAFLLGAVAVGISYLWLPLGRLVGFYPAFVARIILFAAKLLAKPRFACIYLTDPAMLWVFVVFYVLCAVLVIRRARLHAFLPVVCAGTVAVCGVLVWRDLSDRTREGYTLTALDVGQGQSLVITSAGHTAVVDCGSSSGVNAGAVTERYIRALGRDSVDALILTHYHADHAGGVERLLATLDVAALIVPEPDFGESDLDETILAAAERAGTRIVFVTDLTSLSLGDANLTLYPPIGGESENERGLFATVSADGFDTLITGDAPGYLERLFLASYALPDIECLIVGHHGSASSTTDFLLDTLMPETAVISVGENSYGHPTPEVLERLHCRGIPVLRTDEDGNITVLSR